MEEWENAQAGISPRANHLMKAPVPPTEEGHENDLAARIMWFADACLSGIKIVPINDRFDALENDPTNGERNKVFSDGFKDKYKGKSLYSVQRSLGEKYEREFAEKLRLQPSEIYSWLTNKTNERIQQQKPPVLPSK